MEWWWRRHQQLMSLVWVTAYVIALSASAQQQLELPRGTISIFATTTNLACRKKDKETQTNDWAGGRAAGPLPTFIRTRILGVHVYRRSCFLTGTYTQQAMSGYMGCKLSKLKLGGLWFSYSWFLSCLTRSKKLDLIASSWQKIYMQTCIALVKYKKKISHL